MNLLLHGSIGANGCLHARVLQKKRLPIGESLDTHGYGCLHARVLQKKRLPIGESLDTHGYGRCQDLLDERVKALTDEMGTDWGSSDFHWASKRVAYPKFVAADWPERAKQLFDAAHEVARTIGPTSTDAQRP